MFGFVVDGLGKLIGEKYRELDDQTKQKYVEMSEKEKQAYQLKMKKFRYC